MSEYERRTERYQRFTRLALKSQRTLSAIRNAWEKTLKDHTNRPELDMKAIVDARFSAGEGTLIFGPETSNEVILLSIKQAIGMGKPFTVIPSGVAAIASDLRTNCIGHAIISATQTIDDLKKQ